MWTLCVLLKTWLLSKFYFDDKLLVRSDTAVSREYFAFANSR